MPVPVPINHRGPAHPVIKINQSGSDSTSSVFKHLTQSLPRPPRGPPPSFATREVWINSLPSWRRNKPRRVWEDDSSRPYSGAQGFSRGLTVADNAAVIKGAPAQACIPPISTLIASAEFGAASQNPWIMSDEEDVDEEMDTSSMDAHGWQGGHDSQFGAVNSDTVADQYTQRVSETAPTLNDIAEYDPGRSHEYHTHHSAPFPSSDIYERGAFTPVFEDMSPEPAVACDPGSSPIGPATPFAEFVDRAVAAAQSAVTYEYVRSTEAAARSQHHYQGDYCGAHCYQCNVFQHIEQPVQAVPPALEPVVTPTASATYKKLAEPLAEWIAGYVWKVCTTGMNMPPAYAQPRAFSRRYASSPPGHLATSTHSMLLSTLLQPSTIFLALWYIVRLPVFFGPVNLGPEHYKEMRFRAELLGEAHLSFDRSAVESYAPFRLILLGCMLANKWLDDHTFSNKTWHSISSVPIRSLNKLESLALDLFTYDLTIQPHDWVDWLGHLSSYHSSLSTSSGPQPISRPSTSPHTIIRKTLESLIQIQPKNASCTCGEESCTSSPPQPVFIPAEEKRKGSIETRHLQSQQSIDVLEIDLDEDGPLREEYLPRRRTSGTASTGRDNNVAGVLPPPAKWSPSADEPIIPKSSQNRGAYAAPRPIGQPSMQLMPAPLAFAKPFDPQSVWLTDCGQTTDWATFPPLQSSYMAYDYLYPTSHSHSRSQSLSYNQAVGEHHNRFRSYSHTRYDQPYSDLRMSGSQYLPPPQLAPRWIPHMERPIYPASYDRPFEFPQRSSVKV